MIKLFALKDARDLLQKLERDYARFEAASLPESNEHVHQSDHAYNFAITAWHMSDWIWQSDPVPAETFRCRSLRQFQANLVKQCPELDICQDLCNGSKHFKISRRVTRQIEKADVSAGPSVVLSTGNHRVGSPIGKTREVLKIELADSHRVKAHEVFDSVLKFWRQFLSTALKS